MHKIIRIMTVGLLATAALAVVQAEGLTIGDKAPPLKVAKWIKGQPVTLGNGNLNVVEFWATWCGPCKVSIPHLTELAHKYKGKVSFTGVSVWENAQGQPFAPNTFDKVSSFVSTMGDKMDYNVAADGPEATMAQSWMAAAGQNGIPAAFLVGKDGRVLWVGHPMGDLDKVIGQVLDGTYDESAAAKQFKDQQDATAKEMADAKAFNEAMTPVGAALKAKDYKGAIGELDKVLAAHPEYTMRLETIKFNLLLRSDEPAAYAYAKDIASKDPYKNDAQALNSLAWAIVDDQAKLKNPDFAVGLAIAQQAVDVSKGEDPMILDTLAVAYSRSGNLDKAIEVEQKAVALLDKAPYPDETKAEIRKRLDTFKQKKG